MAKICSPQELPPQQRCHFCGIHSGYTFVAGASRLGTPIPFSPPPPDDNDVDEKEEVEEGEGEERPMQCKSETKCSRPSFKPGPSPTTRGNAADSTGTGLRVSKALTRLHSH